MPVQRLLALCALLLSVGCDADRTTRDDNDPGGELPPGVFLSAGSTTPVASSRQLRTEPVAWVAMAPGTIPGAVQSSIQAPGGPPVVVGLTDGGFDPVPVPASDGDILLIETSGPPAARSMTVRVRGRVPPRVVRVSPTPHKTDVPLNTRVLVVFSQPMDPSSLTDGVRLEGADGQAVPVHTTVLGESSLAVEIVPDTPLLPSSEYRIQVSGDVVDMAGLSLTASESTFRTGVSTAPPDQVAPVVTILRPAPAQQLLDPVVIDLRATDAGGIVRVQWHLTSAPAGVMLGLRWEATMGDGPQPHTVVRSAAISQALDLPPGVYTWEAAAVDLAGNEGRSQPVTYELLAAAQGSGSIEMASFRLLEWSQDGKWQYAPQVVGTASEATTVELTGFLIDALQVPSSHFAGWQPWPWPCPWGARGSEPTQLFPEVYGDYPLVITPPDRVTADSATFSLRYRIGSTSYEAAVRGPVTAGEPPTSYTGGTICSYWD